ncbi:MAG: CDP-glycerol glycerophosphotransferase family protein, partial [Oscillospiraceae bacterium]|nr:CDP-glycerol glycerophosphotransferase family protein [Oscillospiraceae bacterium]
HTDISEYSKKRGLTLNNLNFWFPGPITSEIKPFIKESIKLLNNENYYAKERNLLLELCFENKDANNCKRICDFFFEKNNLSNKCTLNITPEDLLEKDIANLNTTLKSSHFEIEKLQNTLKVTENELSETKNELESIYHSRSWKLVKFLKRMT